MKKIDKQLSYAPAEFQVSYCGWASPAMREMNGIFRQQLALLCYDQAKSVEELSESLQTPYEYIQDALDSFCKAKMMKKIDGKYLTLFPMLHLKKNYEAGLLCYKFSEEHEIPKKINDILFSLKDRIADLDFYGNDFDLSYLNWFLYTITDNCMISEFRSYFSDKTDEVIFNNSDWRTNNYNYSLCASYNYADEKIEDEHLERRLTQTSTYYQHYDQYRFNNVFDYAPFPYSFEENAIGMGSSEMGRNNYLTRENIDFYLNLVKGIKHDFTEEEQKFLEDFEKHGVVEKRVFVSFARRHFSHDLLAHHLVDDVSRRKLHEAKKCKTKKIKKHEHGGKAAQNERPKRHLFTEHRPWIDNCRFDLIENFHFIPVD